MVTVISGTNRQNSNSINIANLYVSLLKEMGMPSSIIDLAHLPNDFTSTALYENTGKNRHFNALAGLIDDSDKFVFIVPEYNGSFPGVLKAFIDGLEYPTNLRGKKCALVGLSSGNQGAEIALSHLTDILNYLGMHVLANKVKLANIERHVADSLLTNKTYVHKLEKQARQLLDF